MSGGPPELHLSFVDYLIGLPGIGVAVSGGSDSCALLHLIKNVSPVPVYAASVNHGLRAEAGNECAHVAAVCAQLDVPHETLHWDGQHTGNLQSAARDARYRLLAGWAADLGIPSIALGHTADDQAETVLMRLARGAGVEGLAGIPSFTIRGDVKFHRPLLNVRRESLRGYLNQKGLSWIDDPSNEDDRFERVRIRKALKYLHPLGVTTDRLCQVAENMEDASYVLTRKMWQLWNEAVQIDSGDVLLPDDLLAKTDFDTGRRLLNTAISIIARGDYAPRRKEQRHLLQGLRSNHALTLGGCQFTHSDGMTRITREHNAVRNLTCPTDQIWDKRWQLSGPHAPDLHIAALGEAVKDCPDWRDTGLPRTSLLASPAIWKDDTLIAAPLARYNPDWTAQIVADFHSSLLTH